MGMTNDQEATSGLRLPPPVRPGEGWGEGFDRAPASKAACSSRHRFLSPALTLTLSRPYRKRGPDGRRGFTLFELLIATAVVGLILASVVPFIMAKREDARRIACMANLQTLRNALNAYVTDNKAYPRVRYDPAAKPEGYVAFTGADDPDPFSPKTAVAANDVTASLWLLVRGGYVKDTAAFVCPSSDEWPDRLYDASGNIVPAKRRGNFRSGRHLSYSVFCMFGSAVKDGWTDTLQSRCVLLADKNPGSGHGDAAVPTGRRPEAYAVANSHNHNRAGQSVLWADGAVSFERTPYVGAYYAPPAYDPKTDTWSPAVNGDNIYTALAPRPLAASEKPPADGAGVVGRDVGPAWAYDSYLVPTADD